MKDTFQVISDVHLEMRGKEIDYATLITPCASNLIIAGDLGRPLMRTGNTPHYKAFLWWCSERWTHVFLVFGNHEFIDHERSHVQMEVERMCMCLPNVTLLQDEAFRFGGDSQYEGIYGCTLWSPVTDDAFARMIDKRIWRDRNPDAPFDKHIRNIDASIVRQWNEEHISKLNNFLDNDTSDKRWIIATHHAPCVPPGATITPLNSGFYNDITIPESKVGKWVFGHTHEFADFWVGKTRCISNPLGYPDENTGYFKEYSF